MTRLIGLGWRALAAMLVIGVVVVQIAFYAVVAAVVILAAKWALGL